MNERIALISHLRALLLERGINVAQGRRQLEKELPGILADETLSLSPRVRQLVSDLREEWQGLDLRFTRFDQAAGRPEYRRDCVGKFP
ncbi:hypothetical protein J2848_006958 [Azospirillum lipoferum]|uniref:Uncharacterized protein n=1 Tax=Azospirillum lipoferum TaxID=193 RepID=A0A5A9G5C0_AZOLI|nr:MULTISPECIES: hypothetical protein [Azospirillum]KAA0588439.1 hypothetical protein FZ942_33400 [Azospirillum lipoferum]MCP1615245.1 hypothetical protein [Azospirillum lipoferum]MDW5534062.1 hypothetical protein [Azospirillum sp. NL1]